MTALDRVLEAISDESPISRESQLELVNDLLRRRHRPDQGRLPFSPFEQPNPAGHLSQQQPTAGVTPRVPPAEQTVWSCSNCLRDWSEPFCDECGANLTVRRIKK